MLYHDNNETIILYFYETMETQRTTTTKTNEETRRLKPNLRDMGCGRPRAGFIIFFQSVGQYRCGNFYVRRLGGYKI